MSEPKHPLPEHNDTLEQVAVSLPIEVAEWLYDEMGRRPWNEIESKQVWASVRGALERAMSGRRTPADVVCPRCGADIGLACRDVRLEEADEPIQGWHRERREAASAQSKGGSK